MKPVERDIQWLLTCPAEITYMMKWYLADDDRRKYMAMYSGGFNEVMQEAWKRIVSNLRTYTQLPCPVTTFAINHTWWALLRLYNKQRRHRRKMFLESVEDDDQPLMPVDADRELDWKLIRPILTEAMKSCLSQREITILTLRHHEDETYAAIGEKFNLSPQRTKQIETGAIAKMRNHLGLNLRMRDSLLSVL